MQETGRQTLVAVAALLACQMEWLWLVLVVLEWSLFGIQMLFHWHLQRQDHPLLQPLADSVSIAGQALAQSHSEVTHGALCTT
jgi:hypothetical protein